jgi:hypothetical protein
MKLKSAIALFTILGVLGWVLPARAQDPGTTGTIGLTSDGVNTYSGSTIVSSGTTSYAGSGELTLSGGTLLNLGTLPNTPLVSSLPKFGAAADVLQGVTVSGGYTISSGSLNVGSGLTLNESGTINLLGTSNSSTYNGLTNVGVGTLVLQGNPTIYNGSAGGTLVIANGTFSPIQAANAGTITLNLAGSSLNTTRGVLTLTGAPNLIVGSNSLQLPIGGVIFSPTVASSYHATDLGNLSDWLANESGASSAIVNSILNSGLFSRTTFSLPGFMGISPTLQNLGSLSNSLDSSSGGWALTQEFGVDTAGEIAVGATAADGTSHALLLSPVPEPASVILAGCGLAALLFARRRFNRRPR